jgi:hypothetical protein
MSTLSVRFEPLAIDVSVGADALRVVLTDGP